MISNRNCSFALLLIANILEWILIIVDLVFKTFSSDGLSIKATEFALLAKTLKVYPVNLYIVF